jgi:hypothetical protein
MPRRGRIRMVGKWEAREREELTDELKSLMWSLHQAWRDRRYDHSTAQEEDCDPN